MVEAPLKDSVRLEFIGDLVTFIILFSCLFHQSTRNDLGLLNTDTYLSALNTYNTYLHTSSMQQNELKNRTERHFERKVAKSFA